MKNKRKKSIFSSFKKLDKKSRITLIASITAIVMSVTIILGLGIKMLLDMKIGIVQPDESGVIVESTVPNPHAGKVVNFLICGVDYDSTPGRDSSGLPDVIMIASFNIIDYTVTVLNVPRDTFVGDDIQTGKVNAVYSLAKKGNKAPALINRLYSIFQIPIDYYIVTNMSALKDTVDLLGGVEMDVPTAINLDGIHVDKGLQVLNGIKASAVVRNRKGAGYDGSDLGRVQVQQEFIKAFAKKAINSKWDLITKIIPNIYSKLETNVSVGDALSFASAARKVDYEKSIKMFMAPGSSTMHKGYSIYNLDAKKVQAMLNDHFRPYDPPLALEDLNIPYGATDKPGSSFAVTTSQDQIPPSSESSSESSDTSSFRSNSGTGSTNSTGSTSGTGSVSSKTGSGTNSATGSATSGTSSRSSSSGTSSGATSHTVSTASSY